MANLKILPKNSQLLQSVKQSLTDICAQQSNPLLLLAYSGGLDSTVLLDILAKLKHHPLEFQAPQFELSAMYVHHGLNQHADDWAEHCRKICQRNQIPFNIKQVQVDIKSGLGVEATARNARYQALMASNADYICLAHHQNDQAETLLLQLARGSGVKGLACMPKQKSRLWRPLMAFSRKDLENYAKENHLEWIEDDSNLNIAYDRNFMRHKVLPQLETHYPAIHKTLARSAEHLAEANELLDDLAELDAEQGLSHPVGQPAALLNLTYLATLSLSRAKNLVRWWITNAEIFVETGQILLPNSAQLEQIMQQLLHAKQDAQVRLALGPHVSIRRYLKNAYINLEKTDFPNIHLVWNGQEEVKLNQDFCLKFEKKMGAGIALQRIDHEGLVIKNRQGGERLKPHPNRPSQTVQHLYQALKIPPWQRSSIPLVYFNDKLVAISHLTIDAEYQAKQNELGLLIYIK